MKAALLVVAIGVAWIAAPAAAQVVRVATASPSTSIETGDVLRVSLSHYHYAQAGRDSYVRIVVSISDRPRGWIVFENELASASMSADAFYGAGALSVQIVSFPVGAREAMEAERERCLGRSDCATTDIVRRVNARHHGARVELLQDYRLAQPSEVVGCIVFGAPTTAATAPSCQSIRPDGAYVVAQLQRLSVDDHRHSTDLAVRAEGRARHDFDSLLDADADNGPVTGGAEEATRILRTLASRSELRTTTRDLLTLLSEIMVDVLTVRGRTSPLFGDAWIGLSSALDHLRDSLVAMRDAAVRPALSIEERRFVDGPACRTLVLLAESFHQLDLPVGDYAMISRDFRGQCAAAPRSPTLTVPAGTSSGPWRVETVALEEELGEGREVLRALLEESAIDSFSSSTTASGIALVASYGVPVVGVSSCVRSDDPTCERTRRVGVDVAVEVSDESIASVSLRGWIEFVAAVDGEPAPLRREIGSRERGAEVAFLARSLAVFEHAAEHIVPQLVGRLALRLADILARAQSAGAELGNACPGASLPDNQPLASLGVRLRRFAARDIPTAAEYTSLRSQSLRALRRYLASAESVRISCGSAGDPFELNRFIR